MEDRPEPPDIGALARFSGEAWVPDYPYFDDAERYIDQLWEQTIWPVVKDCNLAHVVDLAAGHGRNTRKLLEVAGEVVVLDIHSNYTAGTMNWLANPSSRNFMSKELFAHYAFKEGLQVVHQQIEGWGGIDDLDCITLVELPV